MAELDAFAEVDALLAARRSTASAPRDDNEAPRLVAHDHFAAPHAALRDFEVALRDVRRDMALQGRPATHAQRAEIQELWAFAMAAYRNNEAERAECGWAADDLKPPASWWEIEVELLARPDPSATDAQQPLPVVLVNNDKGIPGPHPAPYSRVQLEEVGGYLVKGKSDRWLDANGIISRYRLRAARARGVRWDDQARLELPRGTRTTAAGDLILPRP